MMSLKLRMKEFAAYAGAAVLSFAMFACQGCGGGAAGPGLKKPDPLPLTDPNVKFNNKPIRDTSPLNSYDDPCAMRIDDLCGPLLIYYNKKKHGPEKIEELAPYALAGVPFETTCPVSKKPYLCRSTG